jgi:hypothetical protein
MNNVTELYLEGLSMRQIAERTGISKSVIARRIKQTGVSRDRSSSQILGCKRAPQVPFDWSYFPLTAGKAWLIGLIYGDGSLHNAGRTITLTAGDRDVIENVNHLFGGTLGVSMPTPTYWTLHIHSARLWKELNVAFALVPNKSRVLRYPELSDEMKPHFIRGLLDSDGCWYSDRRSKQPRLGFRYVSLSLEFLHTLRKDLIRLVGVSSKRNVYQGSMYSLAYTNNDAVRIGHWIYTGSTPRDRCERKFVYWSQFIQ